MLHFIQISQPVRGMILTLVVLLTLMTAQDQASAGTSEVALMELQLGETGPLSISSQRNQVIQSLIDEAYRSLLLTSFGGRIVRELLNCSPELLLKHLGLSQDEAYGLSRTICSGNDQYSGWAKNTSHPWLFTLPNNDPDKVVSLRQKKRRSYKILFLPERDALPMDSWTDFKTQTTTIYVEDRISLKDLQKKLLLVLAHETAIYFDQKAQLSAATWSGHPNFNTFSVTDFNTTTQNDLNAFLTAANNPLIAQVLSYVRAFKVEEYWMRQVSSSKLQQMTIDIPDEYNHWRYPFLNPKCTKTCLEHFLLTASSSISKFSLPLLSSSRYWSMKVLELSAVASTDETRRIQRTLINYRKAYVTQINGYPNFLLEAVQPEILRLSQETEQVFEQLLIPQDLETLLEISLSTPPRKTSPAIEFLTVPSLGNFGVEMAAGPRPRIRTGSSYSLNISEINLINEIKGPTMDQPTGHLQTPIATPGFGGFIKVGKEPPSFLNPKSSEYPHDPTK